MLNLKIQCWPKVGQFQFLNAIKLCLIIFPFWWALSSKYLLKFPRSIRGKNKMRIWTVFFPSTFSPVYFSEDQVADVVKILILYSLKKTICRRPWRRSGVGAKYGIQEANIGGRWVKVTFSRSMTIIRSLSSDFLAAFSQQFIDLSIKSKAWSQLRCDNKGIQ